MGCAKKGAETDKRVEVELDNGIIQGHAYGITKIFTLKESANEQLMIIRNPWGRGEWKGDWSDFSDQMSDKQEMLENYVKSLKDDGFKVGDTEDGIFFISFEDFCKNFNKLYITVDFPEKWKGYRYIDYWTADNSGGLPTPNTEEK